MLPVAGGELVELWGWPVQEEELSETEKQFRTERAGGNYGMGTKELQAKNFMSRREQERMRRDLFDDALIKFKKGKVEEVGWWSYVGQRWLRREALWGGGGQTKLWAPIANGMLVYLGLLTQYGVAAKEMRVVQ